MKALLIALTLLFSASANARPLPPDPAFSAFTAKEIQIIRADKAKLEKARLMAMSDGIITRSEVARIRLLEKQLRSDVFIFRNNRLRR